MRPQERIANALLQQRGHLLLWVPICLGVGIWLYFIQTVEPTWRGLSGVALMGAGMAALTRGMAEAWRPVIWACVLVSCGFVWAAARAHLVAEPVMWGRYFGPIEGRVVGLDRSAGDALRVTLDRVHLPTRAPDRTPARVRVSLHGEAAAPILPGERLRLTGHLSAPPGPAEPGGFDFQRHAWFLRLGAVGYTRRPIERLDAPQALWLARARLALSQALTTRIDGQAGAVASAITSGDRTALSQEITQALRRVNLSHLLAISGLHMGLLTGVVFIGLRWLGALWPWLVLRYPVKKWAAAGAMIAGAAYLALSGGAVATERALIMVSVMFVAVMLDRRALTLRAVAVAALVVLALRPEALIGPGFQMSFAATIALVVVFSRIGRGRWGGAAASVVLSSLIAGLATAPIAAAHFNMVSRIGLVANVLSVPVMGAVVMPAAVVAAVLAPFGAEGPALWVMEWGLRWILWIAQGLSAVPWASTPVPSPSGAVIPLIAIGGLWAAAWQGRARVLGLVPVIVAFGLWSVAERPALLISDSGALGGVMGPEGRAMTKPKGDGFAASVWLENDGDLAPQALAASRPGWTHLGRTARTNVDGVSILMVRGKTALAEVRGCEGAQILITNVKDSAPRPCERFDSLRLRGLGALAISVEEGRPILRSVAQVRGRRLWAQ